jgi:hypothetical protein
MRRVIYVAVIVAIATALIAAHRSRGSNPVRTTTTHSL